MAPNFAFTDRHDAGAQVLAALPEIDPSKTIVSALPRGGVPVAIPICAAVGLPLDLVLVCKIAPRSNSELALGAVVDGDCPQIVVNTEIASHFGMNAMDVRHLGQQQIKEIERRRALYLGDNTVLPVSGKTVVIVDDGAATGASMLAALRALRQRGATRLIAALPVAPQEVVSDLSHEADRVICLSTPSPFHSVSTYYANFDQVTDHDVVGLLRSGYCEKPADRKVASSQSRP